MHQTLQSDWNERERGREPPVFFFFFFFENSPQQTELETKASLAAAAVDD
jgi:hypothetical protein